MALNPRARQELLTRLTWLASDQPAERCRLARAFEKGFGELFVPAVQVAVETGDPIGQVLAEHVEARVEPRQVEKILAYLEREDYDGTLPLRELFCSVTRTVLEQRLRDGPEPRTTEQERELANLHHKLGLRAREAGRVQEGLENLGEAVRLRRSLADAGVVQLLPSLAISLDGLGVTFGDLERWEKAIEASREAVAILREHAHPDAPVARSQLAKSLYTLSAAASPLERHEEAHAAASESVALYRELMRTGDRDLRGDLARSLINLAVDEAALGNPHQAVEMQREAVSLFEELAAERPDRYTFDLSMALYGLANRLGDVSAHEESLRSMERAVAIRRELARHRPDVFLASLTRGLYNLGNRLVRMERVEEAVRVTREAVELLREAAARKPELFEVQLGEALNNLGNRLAAAEENDEALSVARETVAIRRRLAARAPALYEPELAQALSNLGLRLAKRDRHEEALEVAAEATGILRRVTVDNPRYRPSFAIARVNEGRHLCELGRARAAVEVLTDAVEAWKTLAAGTRTGYREHLGNAYFNLGRALRDLAELPRAIEATERALALYRELARDHPMYRDEVVEKLMTLGLLLVEARRLEDALAPMQEAIRIARRVSSRPYRSERASALREITVVWSRLDRHQEALEAVSEAATIERELAGRQEPRKLRNLAHSLRSLAVELFHLGRFENALVPSAEALELDLQAVKAGDLDSGESLAQAASNRIGILQALGKEREAMTLLEAVLGSLAEEEALEDVTAGGGWLTGLVDGYLDVCERAGQPPDGTLVRRLRRGSPTTTRIRRSSRRT